MSTDLELWAQQARNQDNSEEERRAAATCYRAGRAERGKPNCKHDFCVEVPAERLASGDWICVKHGAKG